MGACELSSLNTILCLTEKFSVELDKLVREFRGALESTTPHDFDGTSLAVSQFPDACCDDSSLLLAAYLADNGFPEVHVIRGADGGSNGELGSHVWLELDGIQIDITADQFNDYGYSNQPVIIERENEFLSTFDSKNAGAGDFREFVLKYNDAGLMGDFKDCYSKVIDIIGENT